jgi:hypothetical protein
MTENHRRSHPTWKDFFVLPMNVDQMKPFVEKYVNHLQKVYDSVLREMKVKSADSAEQQESNLLQQHMSKDDGLSLTQRSYLLMVSCQMIRKLLEQMEMCRSDPLAAALFTPFRLIEMGQQMIEVAFQEIAKSKRERERESKDKKKEGEGEEIQVDMFTEEKEMMFVFEALMVVMILSSFFTTYVTDMYFAGINKQHSVVRRICSYTQNFDKQLNIPIVENTVRHLLIDAVVQSTEFHQIVQIVSGVLAEVRGVATTTVP